MKSDNQIQICFLNNYPSLLNAVMVLTGLSKSQVKKFFSKRSQLNIEIKAKKIYTIPIDLINYNQINPNYLGPDIEVLFEDDFFIALNKPSNLHTHPLNYSSQDNLVSFIASRWPKLAQVNKENWDRGFVYRLDYETSGIIYFAKSDKVYNFVRENFKNIMEKKYYRCIVEGVYDGEDKLDHFYEQPKGAPKVLVGNDGLKNKVCLHIKAIEETESTSVLKVMLLEGKRHQIRAQLAFAGYPILGDELYGAKKDKRLFLHCEQYIFNYMNTKYDFECEFIY